MLGLLQQPLAANRMLQLPPVFHVSVCPAFIDERASWLALKKKAISHTPFVMPASGRGGGRCGGQRSRGGEGGGRTHRKCVGSKTPGRPTARRHPWPVWPGDACRWPGAGAGFGSSNATAGNPSFLVRGQSIVARCAAAPAPWRQGAELTFSDGASCYECASVCGG